MLGIWLGCDRRAPEQQQGVSCVEGWVGLHSCGSGARADASACRPGLGCACGTVDQQQGVLFCSRGRWTPPVVAMVQEGGVMRL